MRVNNSDLPNWLAGNQAIFASTQVNIAAILNPQIVPLSVSAKKSEEILPPPVTAPINKTPEIITEDILSSSSVAVQERPDKTATASEQTAPQDRVVRTTY